MNTENKIVALIGYEPMKGNRKLLVYEWENRLYPVEYKLRITREQVVSLYEHLSKVFAVSMPKVTFRQGRGSGYFRDNGKRISLNDDVKNNSFRYYVAVHEFAHHLAQWHRKKDIGHHKDFRIALQRCYLASNGWHRELPRKIKVVRGYTKEQIEQGNKELEKCIASIFS
jgi:hypothetical protein